MSYLNMKLNNSLKPGSWFDCLLIVVIILCLVAMLFAAIRANAQMLDPDDYGIPKNGSTDCTSDWEALDANMVAGSIVVLPPGADYYTNTSGGITFTKAVHIIGSGAKFTCGSTVGNNSALTFEGDRTVLEGFEIDCTSNHTDGNDDDFADAGDSLASHNYRRGILLQGDHSICRGLTTTCCVVGVEVNADYCTVEDCLVKNTSIVSGGGSANNYHAGILMYYADYGRIDNNTIDGHGQNILASCSFYGIITGNIALGASNNGIYVSSGGDFIIKNNIVQTFDSSGIKARDSGNNISDNRVICDGSAGTISGITMTGNGSNDGGGFNGANTIAHSNIITGDTGRGLEVGKQDSYHFKNIHLFNNIIALDPNGSLAKYGIHFNSTASDGAMVIGNSTSGHSFGILTTADSGYEFNNMLIGLNQMIGGSNDAFSLSEVHTSLIIGNQGKNCASGRTGLLIDYGQYNRVFCNNFGDDQKPFPTQKYGIEGRNGSDYNCYIYNNTDGATYEYYNIGPYSITRCY